jgi:uncharacterized protein (TIGR00290 family)
LADALTLGEKVQIARVARDDKTVSGGTANMMEPDFSAVKDGVPGGLEPVLLAWSGGKDSTLALETLWPSQRWRVIGLLTTVTETYERISMHGVRTALLREQAAAIGLPLTIVHIPASAADGVYEERMGTALAAAREQGVRSVAFGDLFLEDVRAYREKMLGTVEMTGLFPLWGKPTAALAEYFIASGYRAVLSCVDTQQISGELAGREYDRSLLADLPDSADPCGERGEFHTFVSDGPLFTRAVAYRTGERVLREGRFMYCDLIENPQSEMAIEGETPVAPLPPR